MSTCQPSSLGQSVATHQTYPYSLCSSFHHVTTHPGMQDMTGYAPLLLSEPLSLGRSPRHISA
jgi:hypothetical protein